MICPHCKKLIEEHVESSDVIKVLDKMREVSNKRWRNTESNKRLVRARLKEGFSVEDCFNVITNRWDEWGGTEMETYFRPATIFRASKFEGYLMDARADDTSALVAKLRKKGAIK